jgi:hypothetical protein
VIYQVHHYDEIEGCQGFAFFGTKREAQADVRKWKTGDWEPATGRTYAGRYQACVVEYHVPATKDELLGLLTIVAGHPDNG